jgi:purine nucleosidase
MNNDKIKILLDTDIGSDIDDAVTLAYLLAQPRCELVGITTVTGKPVERAMVASAICKVAGNNVTIIPGAENQIDGSPPRQPEVPQAVKLPNWDHDTEFPDQDAVEFMAETIRKNPGEIVLLAVGPMTNVGRLFKTHPDIPGLLKSLQMMSGRFTNYPDAPKSEWNVHCDPTAAEIVYTTDVAKHTSLGLDVTMKVVVFTPEVVKTFKHKFLDPVLDMYHVGDRKRVYFHDPLAAVTLFDDSMCTFENGTATVNRINNRDDGAIDWAPDKDGPHTIGLTVDVEGFFKSYFSVFESRSPVCSFQPISRPQRSGVERPSAGSGLGELSAPHSI